MTDSPVQLAEVDVREKFADHCQAIIFDGTTVRIDFGVTRYLLAAKDGKSPKAQRVTVERLVLTPQATTQLLGQLGRVLGALESKGLVKRKERKAVTSQ